MNKKSHTQSLSSSLFDAPGTEALALPNFVQKKKYTSNHQHHPHIELHLQCQASTLDIL